MSHFIFKLISGEFVYGTIADDKNEKGMVILNNPLTWQEYDDENGRVGNALVKFVCGTNENQIPISTSSIMSMAKMSPIFEEFYEAAVIVQNITSEAYDESLSHMTAKMYELVLDHHDRMQAYKTGELVISNKKTSNTTYH